MSDLQNTRTRPALLWRWVARNSDKPHRCPACHAVRTFDAANRWHVTLACPKCRVRWWYGRRP